MANCKDRNQLTQHGINIDSGYMYITCIGIDTTEDAGAIAEYVSEYIIQRSCRLPELNRESRQKLVDSVRLGTTLNEDTFVEDVSPLILPEIRRAGPIGRIRNTLFRSNCLSSIPHDHET
jgi:hypothetical protein